MKKKRFNGPLGAYMKKHLAFRRSLGCIYNGSEYHLDAFDQYLALQHPKCKTITRQMVVGYLASISHLTGKTRSGNISSLRQFCRYMFQYDINTYIPEKGLIGSSKVQVKPHIFTKDEIVQLINQARQMRLGWKTLLPDTYATIIALLWVTGMRIGELVRLKMDDIDFVNGLIYIRQTKFFKSRIIPVSSSSLDALRAYKIQRTNFGYSEGPEAPFFLNAREKPCITATTPRTIRELMIKAGLKTAIGKIPRVHDIRHSFATCWLQDFYQKGKDPTAYLAILATYMGHANIANTQTYLHPSIEALHIAGQKLRTINQCNKGNNHAVYK